MTDSCVLHSLTLHIELIRLILGEQLTSLSYVQPPISHSKAEGSCLLSTHGGVHFFDVSHPASHSCAMRET